MPNDSPLVSIYIPTYNRLDILKRAIRSVLDQSYAKLELIVVDDCSTDSTNEYLEDLSKRDFRLVHLRNSDNQGACVSRNRAIEYARGEFITGLEICTIQGGGSHIHLGDTGCMVKVRG